MGSLRTALAAGLTFLLVEALDGGLGATAYAQSDADRAAARAAATAGLRAFQEGRFQEAVDYCTRAEALMHAPTHLLLLARSQTKLGHLVEAQEAYFRLKRDAIAPNAPKAFVDAQASAADEQAALAPRIPTLKIALEGAPAKDVTLTLDGQSVSAAIIGLPKPVNPGPHTLSAHASNAESDPATVTVSEGAAQNVTLTMHAVAGASVVQPGGAAGVDGQPVPEHGAAEGPHGGGGSGLRVAGWVGVGVGVVGAALGTFFILKSHSDRSSADSLCDSNGCPLSKKGQIDDLDSASTREGTLAWVSYGVGVAGLGTGIVLLVMSGGKSTTEPQAAGLAGARPWVGPGSAGVTVRF